VVEHEHGPNPAALAAPCELLHRKRARDEKQEGMCKKGMGEGWVGREEKTRSRGTQNKGEEEGKEQNTGYHTLHRRCNSERGWMRVKQEGETAIF